MSWSTILNSCATSGGWIFQTVLDITSFARDSFFSFLLQCFKNIVPTFNNLILHSIFYRFRHHPYVLGKLYLLLFLFHGKRYKIANLHICRLLLQLHDYVKNSSNKSEITQWSPNLHTFIKYFRFKFLFK